MAYIRKITTKKGVSYKAEIELKGVRKSQNFALKQDARDWAAKEEAAINAGASGSFPRKTVADAFDKYWLEVSKDKKGTRAEGLRFERFKRDYPVLAATVISEVKTPDLVKWRDDRLKRVSESSVLRELTQYRNVWTIARDEWQWCGQSPWTAMRKPEAAPPRDQRTPWQFVKRIVRWLGYRTGQKPKTGYQQTAYAYLIGLRTAMRAKEIMGLTRETINLKTGVVTLLDHKTDGTVGTRYVPLLPPGRRLLAALTQGEGPLWTIKTGTIDALFRKAKSSLGVTEDITFHDGRAEALTELSRKMDVMTLQKISGHRDINVLIDSYYREKPEQIAARLAAGARAPGPQRHLR